VRGDVDKLDSKGMNLVQLVAWELDHLGLYREDTIGSYFIILV
jgi:hypothetical protein